MKILFFDVETTGLSSYKNGIHQLAGLIDIDNVTKETFNIKIKPDPKLEIDPEALKVSNTTLEQLNSYPEESVSFKTFQDLLDKYVDRYNPDDKFFLCGYNNIRFDNEFLRKFFSRNGENYFGSYFWSNTLDMMALATPVLMEKRHKMENFKLSSVAKMLSINLSEDKLHDALYDVYLTKEVYNLILT